MVRFAVHGERVFFGTYNSKDEAYRKFHQFYKNIFQEEPFDLSLLSEQSYGVEDSPP
jgi:prolyl-tRNA synthetase